MANPRNNLTTVERWNANAEQAYAYGIDVIDSNERRTRLWFRNHDDRAEFAELITRLHEVYGHSTTVELV